MKFNDDKLRHIKIYDFLWSPLRSSSLSTRYRFGGIVAMNISLHILGARGMAQRSPLCPTPREKENENRWKLGSNLICMLLSPTKTPVPAHRSTSD